MRVVAFLQVVRHLGRKCVAVALLADSRVGSMPSLVAPFYGFLDRSLMVNPCLFGGKRRRVGDLAADDVQGSGGGYLIRVDIDSVCGLVHE